MRNQLHKLEGIGQDSGVFFREERNTHFYVSADAGASVLPSLPRWHSGSLPATICLFKWTFYKACGIKVLFLFQFLWPLHHEVLIWSFMVSFLLMVLFVRIKTKVFLPTTCVHLSVALPRDQTLPVCCSPSLFPPFPRRSIIPKIQESAVFQMCRNDLSLEQRSQTVECDFRRL